MAQVTRQLDSEREAWAWLLERARADGDARGVRVLEAAQPGERPPLPAAWMALRDEAMHRRGVGTTRAMRSVVTGVFVPSWTTPIYTLPEKLGLWRGKWSPASAALWDELLATDLPGRVPRLGLPVHFLHGLHDRTVSYRLARAYAAGLEAPAKGFYTFPESAHSPLFEEPERARAILRDDVLRGVQALADGHLEPRSPPRP
jgi:pimeloyl-ACP methyl ester carboxylesterase